MAAPFRLLARASNLKYINPIDILTNLAPEGRGIEDEVRELLGLPEDALTMGLLPLGYPVRGRWAQPKRRPVGEVAHWDQWGAARPRP
jgi:hypothetical protein